MTLDKFQFISEMSDNSGGSQSAQTSHIHLTHKTRTSGSFGNRRERRNRHIFRDAAKNSLFFRDNKIYGLENLTPQRRTRKSCRTAPGSNYNELSPGNDNVGELLFIMGRVY